ncbi:hypothetical protein [Ilumatobacter sp.]|uniref:hypothetical protein n=1 Tax=Ilumatobacter sp. TaxID=1967498 RepID=UPI00375245BD
MGQLVAVTEKPSSTPGVVRFEINRTLSGQGHERFRSILDAHGNTPSDELARRLFGTGQVASVHVYANIITVDLEKGYDSAGLADLVRDLHTYWKPGVKPPSLEELQPDEPAAAGSSGSSPGGDSGGDSGGVALSAEAQKVPPHLLERGRAARTKWNSR